MTTSKEQRKVHHVANLTDQVKNPWVYLGVVLFGIAAVIVLARNECEVTWSGESKTIDCTGDSD